MTVTGAAMVFSAFPAESAGRSFSFASRVRRKTKRAGEELALVGAHFSRS